MQLCTFYNTLCAVCLFFSAVGVTEEETAEKPMGAVQISTTGNPGAGGLVPGCASRSLSYGNSSLATPNEWSHGAHWYRSSAVLLRYHK